MPLADEVLAERRRLSGNPEHAYLSDDVIALCNVIEEKILAKLDRHIAEQNRKAAGAILTNHEINQLPKMYAEGYDPLLTARGKDDLF